jgi:hypothetical protein
VAHVGYEIGPAYDREIAGERLGTLKLLCARVGTRASHLIHFRRAGLSFGGPAHDFVGTVFNIRRFPRHTASPRRTASTGRESSCRGALTGRQASCILRLP